MLYHLNERKMFKIRNWDENSSDRQGKKLRKIKINLEKMNTIRIYKY